jgi:hypothetical protein
MSNAVLLYEHLAEADRLEDVIIRNLEALGFGE